MSEWHIIVDYQNKDYIVIEEIKKGKFKFHVLNVSFKKETITSKTGLLQIGDSDNNDFKTIAKIGDAHGVRPIKIDVTCIDKISDAFDATLSYLNNFKDR